MGLQDLGSMRGVEEIRKQPEVDRLGVAAQMAALPLTNDPSAYMPLLAPTDDVFGTSIWRGVVTAGRRPDPRAADEIVLSEAHARLLNAHVGDRLPLIAFDTRQAEACLRADEPAAWCDQLSRTPRLRVRVVGVVRTGIDLNGRTQDISFSTLSRGFFDLHRADIAWNPVLMVKLRSATAAKSFAGHARTALGNTQGEITPLNDSAIADAVNVLSTALLLFALVAAVAAAFAVGQSVVRQVAADAPDRVTLAALGTTRTGRVLDAAGAVGVAACAGALLAVCGAYLASTFMPIGLARRAEAARGFDFDALVLGVGALVLVGFVIVTAVVGTFTLARSGGTSRSKRPTLATRLATAPVSPSTAIGFRNAFGGKRDAVPVRAAFGGIAAATAGVVAVVVFGAGLHHLVRTPALYGWGWDAMDIQYSAQNLTRLQSDRDVADIAMIERRAQATVSGHPTFLLAITPVRGSMQPTLVRGRLPQTSDEVALGRDTLGIAHTRVGDYVVVHGSKAGLSMRVVGISTFATSEDGDPLAEGAVVTPTAKRELMGNWISDDASGGQRNYAVRFRAGVDREGALARLERAVPSGSDRSAFSAPSPPAEVEKLRQIESLPRWLAAFLAALGLLAISHASFVGGRRRQRDFSILRAIGFRPRDVRMCIAYEALALAVCGALIGIPLGILIGRFAWQNVADGIGVHVTQRIEVVALLAVVPAAALAALGAALIPARRAARTRPGEMLRTE
ncbi:MAG TPA: ABC transporter permease [Acidimicrobiia bacterium]|nr:ABC transporter permease [Acidimicrobiia bacterium]